MNSFDSGPSVTLRHSLASSSLTDVTIPPCFLSFLFLEYDLYPGIFNAACGLGPAIGYLVGGAMLNIYTDVRVDQNK